MTNDPRPAEGQGGWSRRGFLRELIRGAVEAVDAVDSSMRELHEPDGAPLSVPAFGQREETVPAGRATRLASDDDLRRLCLDVGIGGSHVDEAVALARRSFRLTAGEGGSALGGAPLVPPGFEWPLWEDTELTCLARVRLDELPASALPSSGALVVLFALPAAEVDAPDAAACRIVVVPDGAGRPAPGRSAELPELHVAVSTELTLPPEPVSAESGEELEAWTELRRRLAVFQGVELEEVSDHYHALHRLLGHPDAYDVEMALDAARAELGVDLETELYADPTPTQLDAARRWRLLLQLSSDDELGLSFGDLERLLVWIRDDDLRAGRFDRVRAFVRA